MKREIGGTMENLAAQLPPPPRPRKPEIEGVKRDTAFESYLLSSLKTIRANRAQDDTWHDPNDRRIHVSEIGTVMGKNACHRNLWYKRHDVEGVISLESMMNFEIGHSVHKLFAEILAAMGDVQSLELPGEFDPFPIKGRLDILTSDKLKAVIDWKTATIKQLNYLPKWDHFAQANQYLWAVRRKYSETFSDYKVKVVYVFKDPTKGQPTFAAYEREYDEKMALECLNEGSKAYQVSMGDTIPDRPVGFTPEKFPCSYCPFAYVCWQAGNSAFNIEAYHKQVQELRRVKNEIVCNDL